MPRPSDVVAVYADLDRFSEPRRMGVLRRQVGRGGDVFSFEYERDWLKTAAAFTFDPDLALVQGFTDWEFLLGVHDETRLGAIRFQDPVTGRWMDTEDRLAAPPLTSLRDLQAASLHFEQSAEAGDVGDQEKWLAQLFAPGSSLGGARPKASIRDEDGALCIAKFPSRQDRRDMGAWELVAHRLAAKAGINVPPVRGIRVTTMPHEA